VRQPLEAETGSIEVRRKRQGVEARRLDPEPHRTEIESGLTGVAEHPHGPERPRQELEREPLKGEDNALEREDKALEVGCELPEDGGGVRTLGAFRIGAGAQATADRRRGCVPAGRGLFDRRFTRCPGGLSGASGPRCLFTRARRRSARGRFPGRGWPGWKS